MNPVVAQVGGLDLRFHPTTNALGAALGAWLGAARASAGEPAGEAISVLLASGEPPSLSRDGSNLVVGATPETLGAGLRGALGAALDARGGALLHGAGLVVGPHAVLAIAPSEGGKTTLCGKLAGRLPVLSDETVLLHLEPRPALGGSCFWSGPPLPTAAGVFPLAAVCFLRKGGSGLEAIDRVEALAALLAEWHLPERPGAAADAIARAARLLEEVPSFTLHSTLDGDPFEALVAAARPR